MLVTKGTKKNGGMVAPSESIYIAKSVAGTYGIAIRGGATTEPGTRFRIMHAGSANGTFAIHHKNGNVYDPGSCKGVLTVGALRHDRYEKGPLEAYSSYGPTPDGRQKPEVVAPTGVKTTQSGWFSGTSAACPHAAGVLAIYAQASELSPPDLIDALIADAVPMGAVTPNDAYGWGRMVVPPAAGGWQCDAESSEEVPCSAGCGTIGVTSCGKTCRLKECLAPAEICNGDDDDCDGDTDEGFECAAGSEAPCTSTCFSAGTRVCTPQCKPGLCQPPAESCNGADDDCDGETDEAFPCVAGAVGECTTACGSVGSRACGESCAWSACAPPVEVCNGADDNCDGETDEGFEPCIKVDKGGDDDGGCSATHRGSGGPWLWLVALAMAAVVWRRRRTRSAN